MYERLYQRLYLFICKHEFLEYSNTLRKWCIGMLNVYVTDSSLHLIHTHTLHTLWILRNLRMRLRKITWNKKLFWNVNCNFTTKVHVYVKGYVFDVLNFEMNSLAMYITVTAVTFIFIINYSYYSFTLLIVCFIIYIPIIN